MEDAKNGIFCLTKKTTIPASAHLFFKVMADLSCPRHKWAG